MMEKLKTMDEELQEAERWIDDDYEMQRGHFQSHFHIQFHTPEVCAELDFENKYFTNTELGRLERCRYKFKFDPG